MRLSQRSVVPDLQNVQNAPKFSDRAPYPTYDRLRRGPKENLWICYESIEFLQIALALPDTHRALSAKTLATRAALLWI